MTVVCRGALYPSLPRIRVFSGRVTPREPAPEPRTVPKWRRRVFMTAGALALAAAVLVLLLRPPSGALPAYAVSVESAAAVRAAQPGALIAIEPTPVVRLARGASARVTLTPAKPVVE